MTTGNSLEKFKKRWKNQHQNSNLFPSKKHAKRVGDQATKASKNLRKHFKTGLQIVNIKNDIKTYYFINLFILKLMTNSKFNRK